MSLEITDLSFGYGKRPVLDGVSVTARRGELLGLLGPNGSGKSTVLKTVARIHAPGAGSITWDGGTDLRSLSRRDLARLVAYVPQNIAATFSLEVREAVALGRTPHGNSRPSATDWEHVDRALDVLGLRELVGRSVTELSGGQAQRVLIARALAQEPSVLLLDEPTSALDLKYQLQTLSLARAVARQRDVAAIIAIHDLNQAARYCDRIAFLLGGRIIAHGTPREVFSSAIVREVYGIDVEIAEHGGHVLVHPLDDQEQLRAA